MEINLTPVHTTNQNECLTSILSSSGVIANAWEGC